MRHLVPKEYNGVISVKQKGNIIIEYSALFDKIPSYSIRKNSDFIPFFIDLPMMYRPILITVSNASKIFSGETSTILAIISHR